MGGTATEGAVEKSGVDEAKEDGRRQKVDISTNY